MDAKVTRMLRGALTVEDLIAELRGLPPGAIPVFVCDYGDHSHTQQALPVRSVRAAENAEALHMSAYSQSGICVRDHSEDDPDGDSGPTGDEDAVGFVILSASRA